ncbi:MAG TPA: NAD-binding protein [Anaerolineaceae bacterium]|nr:NAD-binding protein [Anaerolineaceae bacterium]
MVRRAWRDFFIILSTIWINLILFILLMGIGALLLRYFGANPTANWPQLFLDTFHLATIKRVDTGGKLIPILMAFSLPVFTSIIFGEGILRVMSIYMQRRVNRKEWDLMVVKTFKGHTVICGVGEMGQQILRCLVAEEPDMKMVLIDPHSSILFEMGIAEDHILQLQGSMTEIEILKQARVQQASLVILTAGEDAVNLEAAYKILHLNPDVPIWIRLHHSGLAELLDLARKPQIHFFSPYQQAADAIVTNIMNGNRQPM